MDKNTWDGENPKRIDTHISVVFLVGDKAWKLKKAVKFPFLDFSTLEQRRLACERELELNALWSPDLYLGLVAITQDDTGKLALNGSGQVVEYLISMRRFPDNAGMLKVLQSGKVDRTLITGLVQTLWSGYSKAAVHLDCGGAKGMAQIIDGLEPSFAPDVPTEVFTKWRQALANCADVLDTRQQSGMVRRCHGDLHLGNVCLFHGALSPFDVLEFNEDFGTIDIAYDLAFLIMDLLAHQYLDLAALVFNRYLDVSGDYSALAVMPLFLSIRAGVRAMVMRSMNRPDEAHLYLDLALRVLVPPKPRLIAVGGLSGSGKSRLSSRLSSKLAVPGAAIIRSDAIRKRLMGVAQTTKLGQDGYTPEVTQAVYTAMMEACAVSLGYGFPVIADAVFGRLDERQDIQSVADRNKVPFKGFWLEAPFDVAAARVEKRKGDASDATVAILEHQHQRDVGPIHWMRINTTGAGDRTVSQALKAICN